MSPDQDIPLSDTPHSTAHTDPYGGESQESEDGAPKKGSFIQVADGKPVPGFQMRTSNGSLWRPLSMAKGEEEMKVVAVTHGAEFQGISGLTEVECEIEGFDSPVLAFFRGSHRIA